MSESFDRQLRPSNDYNIYVNKFFENYTTFPTTHLFFLDVSIFLVSAVFLC